MPGIFMKLCSSRDILFQGIQRELVNTKNVAKVFKN